MFAGFLVGLKIALIIISLPFVLSEVPALAFFGFALALVDVAWIFGWLPAIFRIFAEFSALWWLGLVLGLVGTIVLAVVLLVVIPKLVLKYANRRSKAVAYKVLVPEPERKG